MSLLEPADVKMSKGKKENVISLKHSVILAKYVYTYREFDFGYKLLLMLPVMECNQYIYSSAVLKYNYEVNCTLSIFLFCYFILPSQCNWKTHVVLFTPLHLFPNSSKLHFRLHAASEPDTCMLKLTYLNKKQIFKN